MHFSTHIGELFEQACPPSCHPKGENANIVHVGSIIKLVSQRFIVVQLSIQAMELILWGILSFGCQNNNCTSMPTSICVHFLKQKLSTAVLIFCCLCPPAVSLSKCET
ncbi:unnamed protein product [Ilex paraguariensis]|uniref:Uncharacterized protein n=1 Tax=Ilex paraguariensis TaxID=185542 RepID=A0ABC8RMS1_9AQUA